jgi:hypothetical protein
VKELWENFFICFTTYVVIASSNIEEFKPLMPQLKVTVCFFNYITELTDLTIIPVGNGHLFNVILSQINIFFLFSIFFFFFFNRMLKQIKLCAEKNK